MHSSANSDTLRALLRGNLEDLALPNLLRQHEESGNTWIVRKGVSISGAWYARDDQTGEQYVAHPAIAKAEVFLASWIRPRIRDTACSRIPILTQGLTDSQAHAARLICENKLSCLSGLPGTGKTYTMKAVCRSLEKSGRTVLGCALTGAAAARLRDTAEISATTIHRLLGYNPSLGGFQVEEVPADAVILDEASMPDAGLLLHLCSRLSPKCILVLVGDPNQLPGVQPGDVFRELCQVLPHARLTEIIRQEADSPIGHAAESILSGHVPSNEDNQTGQGGIYVIPCDGLGIYGGRREKNHPLTIAERMADLDKTQLAEIRTMGITNEIVDILNQQFSDFRRTEGAIPVMCIKNRHDLGVYNGDIGRRERNAQRINDRLVTLRAHEHRDAWCITPWKMQGNEALSCQLWTDSRGFLDRRICYTALTRAKRRFAFVGGLKYLHDGIQSEPDQRITLLSKLIREQASYVDPNPASTRDWANQ